MEEQKRFPRIGAMDALRGLAVILMVIHHFLYDLVAYCGLPGWLFENPLFNFLHYIFAGLFILLSGVSSVFSRSNLKRGLKAYALAMVITVVTTVMDSPVRFGVLHLLGTAMIFYGLTHRFWDAIPRKAAWPLYLSATALTLPLVRGKLSKIAWLWAFGWFPAGFYSADYFPIFPWLFVFLTGTLLGKYIREKRFPEWFYTLHVPALEAVGRRALLIYMLHQPVLYGIAMLLRPVLQY